VNHHLNGREKCNRLDFEQKKERKKTRERRNHYPITLGEISFLDPRGGGEFSGPRKKGEKGRKKRAKPCPDWT